MTRRLPGDAPILSAAAMRAAEARAFASGVTQDELMERAGAAVAREVVRLAVGQAVVVLAGPGNNGGDGYVVARHLATRGLDVVVAALGEPTGDAARRVRDGWSGATVPLAQAPRRPVIVDALFGTGLSRVLSDEVAAAIDPRAFVIAVDLPSGVDTDSGAALGGRGAAVTVALGALKPAHVLQPSASLAGHVLLADIDIAIESEWRTIARPVIAPPVADAHKFSRGLVGVIGGAMPGASRLAARAAMRAGAGYTVLAGGEGAGPDALVHRSLDQLLADDRLGVLVVGPGLGRSDDAAAVLNRAIATECPLVVDGDALSILGAAAANRLAGRRAATILTPHGGEFDRMFAGDGSKIDRTLAAARASGCTIIHKGADTVIARPDGMVTVSANAPSWLASAGTGDVLAGIVGARLAAGSDDPAGESVWLHAEAARLAGPGLIADDLIDHLPAAIGSCR